MSTLMKLSVHGRMKNNPGTHGIRESNEAQLTVISSEARLRRLSQHSSIDRPLPLNRTTVSPYDPLS